MPARLARLVFVAVEAVFGVGAAHGGPSPAGSDPLAGYRRIDRRYAAVGQVYLLVLLAGWLVTIAAAFIGVIEACRPQPLAHSAALSASSLTTLGVVAASGVDVVVAIVEAAVVVTVLALLITYLPALYGAFACREATVAMLSVRGGVPAHGPDLLARQYRADRLFSAPALFTEWAGWSRPGPAAASAPAPA